MFRKKNKLQLQSETAALEARTLLSVPMRANAKPRFKSSPFPQQVREEVEGASEAFTAEGAAASTTAPTKDDNFSIKGLDKFPGNFSAQDIDRAKAVILDAFAWWDTVVDGANREDVQVNVKRIDGPGTRTAETLVSLTDTTFLRGLQIDVEGDDLLRRTYTDSFITVRHELVHYLVGGRNHPQNIFGPIDGSGKVSQQLVDRLEKRGWTVNKDVAAKDLQASYAERYNELLAEHGLADSPYIKTNIRSSFEADPQASEPVVDEPAVVSSEPVVDEPVVVSSEPVVDEPVVVSSEPVVDEPVVVSSEPVVDEPVMVMEPAEVFAS